MKKISYIGTAKDNYVVRVNLDSLSANIPLES